MSKKACVSCGTFFTYMHSNKKFCCEKCRWSYHDKRKKMNNKPCGITLPFIPERFIIKGNSLGEHKSLGEDNDKEKYKY